MSGTHNKTDLLEHPSAIAIIGMAGKFPGAPDIAAFWQNLLAGKDTITRFSQANEHAGNQAASQDFVGARGVLEDAGMFDAEFFGIVPREAARMDPQHRVFLEACYHALEDAGYAPNSYAGEIGLFAGCALNTYLLANLCKDRNFIDEFTANYQVGEYQTLTGNDKDFLTTRVAYKLNLRGPVMTVQSACATSLVAVCQAGQALLNFQCDMALAGGVSITFPQMRGHIQQEGGLASRDGFCRPFDAEAGGTVFGHGAGVVLLKRLEDAVRDGDHIDAVIRGFAVNNDGSQKAGYMAPGVDGQARVIAAAQAMAGVNADTISYIEAHGTGTPLGDPIEVAALTKAFRATTDLRNFCVLGAAKGNVGHLDVAAGVTGLIKTVLSLQQKTIPGLAHFAKPNPELQIEDSPFVLSAETRIWESATPRRAGVSAFGVGGVNAHVVLEESPQVDKKQARAVEHIFCLSARSQAALQSAASNLASHMETSTANLDDVAYTLACGREAFDHRIAFSAGNAETILLKLKAAANAEASDHAYSRRVAFLFPGQGAQDVGMGKALYDNEATFRDVVDECARLAESALGLDLRDLIFTEPSDSTKARLQETQYAQPALFTVEYALAKLWQSWGVDAEASAGHSLGEYVAATLSGVFDLKDAVRLVCLRGKLMQQMQPGSMISVPLGEVALAKYLQPNVDVAGLNSPRASVLSGPTEIIDSVERALSADGIADRRLRTSHAFHSAMMEPMLEAFEVGFAGIELKIPTRPFVSTVTGTWITDKQATSVRFWVEQVRKPVRFADAIATLQASGVNLCVEVGPGETLTTLAMHQRQANNTIKDFRAVTSLPLVRENTPVRSLRSVMAELWRLGADTDWNAFFAGQQHKRVSLPTYPFERKLHWIEPPAVQVGGANESLTQEQPALTSSTVKLEPTLSAASNTPSRIPTLRSKVSEILGELSGVDLQPNDAETSFLELGFDSLFLTQATLALQRALGVKVTFRQMMEQFPCVAKLSDHLDRVLPADAPAPAAPVARAAPAVNALTSTTSTSGIAPAGSLEALFAQQLAAMNNVFQAQVAALQGAGVTGATPLVRAIETAIAEKQTVVAAQAPAGEAEKHGTFQPAQRTSHELDSLQKKYLEQLCTSTVAKTPTSKSLTQQGRLRLADPRAVAGFRPQWKEMVYPIITDRAKGSRLWDVDGNEYIDIVNGFGCILFGHSPDFVVEAIQKQLEIGVAIGPQSALAIEVAELICELTGNERATFCNTGSEAVMAAIRVARTVTGRDKFVYFTGDYHGTFDEVLVRKTARGSGPLAPGIPSENTKNVVVLDYGTDASLEYLRSHASELAAVLIEPVQTRHPENKPFEFIRAVRDITAKNGIAMILDEVVTGFRLAPGGMQEMLSIRADMCTYGKVIGGGHPIGVLSGKAEYLDALDGGAWQFGDDSAPEVGVTFFAGTFVRHPLAMAATRAVLQHLKASGGELQRELNRKTAALAESLDRFFQERGVPSRVHHFASWFYFTFPGDAKLASLFYYALRAKGVHIQEGYPCFLTTAHSDADLQKIEQVFRETILEMQAAHALPSLIEVEVAQIPAGAQSLREPALHALALPHTPQKVKLTESQREIFLAATLSDEANCAFNESLTVRLKGNVRISDLRFALEAVISRHDALRSVVCEDGDCLCIDPVYSGEIEMIDLSKEAPERRTMILTERITAEGAKPFDLHEGPLVRSVCFLNGNDEVALVITAHHLVLDGWSANQLLEEVSVVYRKGAGALTELAPLLPFSSFAAREVARQESGEFAANEAFWVSKYQGRSPRLDLPTDRSRPAMKTYSGATLEGSLGIELCDRVRKFSAKQACSPFVVLLSSFELLMHRLTLQDEVVVGISTAAQSLLEDASLVGHCVNFLPMLSEIGTAQTIEQHVQATRTALFDAQDHQEFTYGSLLRKLKLEREPNRLPLIEVQFNFERVGENVRFDGLETKIHPNPKRFVNTDLFLNVVESANGLTFTCDFNTDLFDQGTIERWMGYWQKLLDTMTNEPTVAISEVRLLSTAEEQMLRNDWNHTVVDFGTFEALPDIVLQHAARTPERIAIECSGRQWTYAELAEYATIIARRLVHEGLKPGQLVGICMERSLEMAGALLAVMMAGGAYVPLDPKHPRERLASIISDAGITLLLTGRDPSVDTSAKILDITGPQPACSEALPHAIGPRDLAYVIYTSGSTGVPKGVAIEHFALMNLLRSMQREPGLTDTDVFVAITTLAFDIAALEIFLPMLTGARLVIASDEEVTNGGLLLRLLQDSSATVMQATPGTWRILLDAGWSATHALTVLCGGEALPRDLADKLLARSSDVWNVYGPTETTIWSSATRVTAGTGPLRLGMPIANTQFYILDENLRPAPIGVAGELCIGGDGLARGYWNRAELTAQQFVTTELGWGPTRIYRTGDLGRRYADGTIELLGRKDFQVKIRGYRIELGEIESSLALQAGVREAVVLEYMNSASASSQLAAFVDVGATLESDAQEKLVTNLRANLERTLPAYMVPQLILPLSELPRLPNTKVDRKTLQRLAAQRGGAATATRTITLPKTEQERQMAAIWAEVLGIEQVSTMDSIFELGADSLAIFRIAARAQKEGMPLKAAKIFEFRTIVAICNEFYRKKPEAIAQTTTRPRIGAAPRSSYRLTRSN